MADFVVIPNGAERSEESAFSSVCAEAKAFSARWSAPCHSRRWLAEVPDSSEAAATSPVLRQIPANSSWRRDRKVAGRAFQNSCTARAAKCGNRDADRWKARCFPQG